MFVSSFEGDGNAFSRILFQSTQPAAQTDRRYNLASEVYEACDVVVRQGDRSYEANPEYRLRVLDF